MATAEQAIIKVVAGELVAGHEFHLALTNIRNLAAHIQSVHDQTSYLEALEVVAKGNRERKAIDAAAEPERQRLQNALNDLRDQRAKLTGMFTEVIEPLEKMAREWNIAERNAAKKEQDDLNKGKRAEHRVEVKPSIPAAPSAARVIPRYRFQVIDISKVKREFLKIDDVKVGTLMRADKDPAKTEKAVGGIRVHVE